MPGQDIPPNHSRRHGLFWSDKSGIYTNGPERRAVHGDIGDIVRLAEAAADGNGHVHRQTLDEPPRDRDRVRIRDDVQLQRTLQDQELGSGRGTAPRALKLP